MSQNKGILRSLYLRSNSSSLIRGALRLLYLRNNSCSLLSFDSIISRPRLLYLRRNSSPLSLLPSSSLLSILFVSLSSLALSSLSFAWPRSCFSFASLILFALTWLNKFPIIGFWISDFFSILEGYT